MNPPPSNRGNATWEEKCTELESVFRNLRIRRVEKASGIPYEYLIPDIGRQLMLMSPIPSPKPVSAKKALYNLARSTGRTVRALDRMPQAALDALNYRQAALRDLKTKLRLLHVAAEQADVRVNTGAPKKLQPRKIARVVAQHYYGLTGTKPTVPKKGGEAYGPFLALLKTVFKILDLDNKVSAVSQAEEISRNWKTIAARFSNGGHGIK